MEDEIKEVSWGQVYRPRRVQDCILPDRLKKPFQAYVDSKTVPSLTLTGTSGVGKTTVAKAMLEEIGCEYLVINGSEERGIDILRYKMTNYASTLSMNGMRKAILIDEADYLTPHCQAAMRNVMEEFSKNCSFILTCNFKSKIIDAIHSRAPVIEFRLIDKERPEMAMLFLDRIKGILTKENVTFDEKVLVEVIKKYFPDYRKTLNILQHFAAQSNNNINSGVLADGVEKNLSEILGYMKERNWRKLRQWVAKYADDSSHVYRSLFDVVHEKFTLDTFSDAVLIIGEHAYRSSFVPDQEIELTMCLVELMTRCTLK
jgi:replication factor C small subunit